jgi:two-component system chemotaxis response regulator CheY
LHSIKSQQEEFSVFPTATKILIADDMMTMRKIILKNCKDLGFTDFVEAVDGQVAWAKLNEMTDIGLVISDWNMPNCTGLDLLKRVRADSRYKNLPFMLVTAESEREQVAEALKAGVDNYVIKPFTADSLRQKMGETFAKAQARGK